jgi:hypothetical protein
LHIWCSLIKYRCHGDIKGEYTSYSNDGVSVVDYVIVSTNVFQYVKYFKVLDKDDSDHFPICCKIEIKIKKYLYKIHFIKQTRVIILIW